MKTQGAPCQLCAVCQAPANGQCSACKQPLCEDHEQVSVSSHGGREVRCPACNQRRHQESLRAGKRFG